ncbi:recombinase family protein [Streptomyces lydicamycinicus]|uniref:recombinase family protein n=1 Tax=Streptomyces lydicamycinicus TaxID=1546107 RepID=UPI003C2C06C6
MSDDRENWPFVDLLLRKSKRVRDGELTLSIRAQEDRGRAWADANRYRVRKVWKENLSAWSDVERPKYDAAMDAVLNAEVPALWCYALDRFSRKGAEAVVPILGKARVVFDYEGLDSMNERDRKWIIDKAEQARDYSNRLSYNVSSTKAKQRNEGRWLSRAPFGLKVNKKTGKLSPDKKKVKKRKYSYWDIVLRIFTEIADGKSARGLARNFNSEGIATAWGNAWRAESIRYIVINPVYEGWLTVSIKGRPVAYRNEEGKRVKVAAKKSEMIPKKLAEKARRVLSGHQILDNTPKEGRSKHLLAERVGCISCRYAMTLNGVSYVCSGPDCELPASVMRTLLEKHVLKLWFARLDNAERDDPILAVVAQRWHALTRPKEAKGMREATAALREAKSALEKFHADDRAGFYEGRSAKYRIPAKVKAEERLTAAEKRVEKLSGGAVDITFLMWGQAEKAWDKADDTLKRELLGLAIDRVYVAKAAKKGVRFDGDSRVVIEWAQPDEEGAVPTLAV